ncbi:MAG: MCE family protein [Acidimicrobiales bacterium]|jgi:phospholipid/cholesterol/gamma-HCH transport system substrate-binding protein
MKHFRERNPLVVGLSALCVLVLAVVGALNFSKLPLFGGGTTYQADFVDASGLATGDIVTVAGVRVGEITGISLDGDKVLVSFTVAQGVHLGDTSSVAAKVLTPLGQEYLEVTPAGPGTQSSAGAIPLSRTSIPNTLIGDLSQATSEGEHYDIGALVKSLEVSSQDLQGTPASLTTEALAGLARFSGVLAAHEQELSTIVTQGAALTTVLAKRSQELVTLVGQSNLVLQVLDQRRQAIHQLLVTTAALSTQLTEIFKGDNGPLTELLSKLTTVSAVLSNDSTKLSDAVPILAAFDRYAANVTGSGPFADVVIPTMLIPDNIIQQCGTSHIANPGQGCQP